MIPLKLSEISEWVEAIHPQAETITAHRIITDSRAIEPGDLFVAIVGERFDGHAFVQQSLERGAVGALVNKQYTSPHELGKDARLLRVEDTVVALGKLASAYRLNKISSHTTVVAITGSNGKTTTKCMLDHVLSATMRGQCAPKSFNNDIGVPLTLLSAEEHDDYLIVEIGTNHPGEISALGRIASPDVAVITSIGEAHLEGLGDIEAIADEKTSLLQHVRSGGVAIVNTDHQVMRDRLTALTKCNLVTFASQDSADVRYTINTSSIAATVFDVTESPNGAMQHIKLNLPGAHHATNATAAFIVARRLGMTAEEISERLGDFTAAPGRTEVLKFGGLQLIDDSYNANPASMQAAIDALANVTDRRRIFVMGDMLELGRHSAAQHTAIVRAAIDARIEVLISVGDRMSEALNEEQPTSPDITCNCFASADDAATHLLEIVVPGDIVWVKGSRAIGLDQLVEAVRKRMSTTARVA